MSGTGGRPYTQSENPDECEMGLQISCVNCPQVLKNGYKGTTNIRAQIYAKQIPSNPDKFLVDDVFPVQNDIIPCNGANVLNQLNVNSVANWVAF